MSVISNRTQEEIDEQENLAYEHIDEGASRYPGMSFEDGVQHTIEWLFRDGEKPIEEESS